MKQKNTEFKKNQIIKDVTVEDITDLGFGVGRIGGEVIFVSSTVPGDVIDARVIKVSSSYLVGRVEKFHKNSALRVCDRCSEKCQSCAYKSISYSEESKIKEEGVRRLFSHGDADKIKTAPITPSPTEARYRNKAQYPITLVNGEYRVGFFAPKSHRVIPVDDCPLTPSVFSDICREAARFFRDEGLSVYDESRGEGLLRHVYLRRGEISEEMLLTVVINGNAIPNEELFVDTMTAKFPKIVGILLNVNQEKTNVVLGEKYVTLYGRDFIYDTLGGVTLKISAASFYQVNHSSAELLYAKAKELAEPQKTDTLLDLFCGAGSIGLSMAKDVGELIGIEIVDSAVECARENAAANGISNAKFYTGDASDTEFLLSRAEKELGKKIKPDIVILDPPRAGCDEKLIQFVCKLHPKRIVYISCNPKTLARDVVKFRALGFNTDTVYPFDLFPMTGHVESVLSLSQKD